MAQTRNRPCSLTLHRSAQINLRMCFDSLKFLKFVSFLWTLSKAHTRVPTKATLRRSSCPSIQVQMQTIVSYFYPSACMRDAALLSIRQEYNSLQNSCVYLLNFLFWISFHFRLPCETWVYYFIRIYTALVDFNCNNGNNTIPPFLVSLWTCSGSCVYLLNFPFQWSCRFVLNFVSGLSHHHFISSSLSFVYQFCFSYLGTDQKQSTERNFRGFWNACFFCM